MVSPKLTLRFSFNTNSMCAILDIGFPALVTLLALSLYSATVSLTLDLLAILDKGICLL